VPTSRPFLALLLLSALTFLAGLGRPAITDADEAYYAEAAREMVEGGDWLTPHFNYRDRFEKPVLYYWLAAAAYRVAGVAEWTARLWSALAGIGLAFLTWSIASAGAASAFAKASADKSRAPAYARTPGFDTAWLAGAIIATTFGYVAEARMALPDLPLAFLITLTIWSAMRASLDPDRASARTAWWVLSGVAAGLGFLTKGPVALVVPGLVLLPIWWREWKLSVAVWRGLMVAGAVAALVGLPWYVAMWLEHGTPYLQSFFIGDNIERFATGRFNDRRIPGYYVAVLLGGLLPWSAYAIALAPGSISRLRRLARAMTPEEWRLVIWAAAPLLFFTVSVGQQPRYILPVLPPVAILVARALAARIEAASSGQPATRLRVATWITAAIMFIVAGLFARGMPLFVTANPVLAWSAVSVVAIAGLVIAATAALGAWRRLPATLVCCAAALLVALQVGLLAGRRPEPVEEMAALVAANYAGGEPVGSYRAFDRNLVFYTRFRHVEIYGDQQAVDFMNMPERVLLVIAADELNRLRPPAGVTLRTLGSVRYVNTANMKLGMLLRPEPGSVLLVTNR
jgi:4-amino-4-deoxy-L-arabinose transferase-like glycosyltransferase